MFSMRFEPQILAAMSRHTALFPPARRDDSYPPHFRPISSFSSPGNNNRPACQRNQMETAKLPPEKNFPPNDSWTKLNVEVTRLNTKGAIFGRWSKRSVGKQRSVTLRYPLNPVDFLPQSGASTMPLHPSRFPLSNETLASLSTFCFPGIIRAPFL